MKPKLLFILKFNDVVVGYTDAENYTEFMKEAQAKNKLLGGEIVISLLNMVKTEENADEYIQTWIKLLEEFNKSR